MHSLYLHKKARQQHQQPSALPEGRADVCNIPNQSRSKQLVPAVHCGFLGNWTWNKVMSGTGFYQINLMKVHTWEKNKPWRILLTVRANNIPLIYFGNWRVCCLLMISNDIFPLKPSVQAGICRKYNCACYALFTQGHSYVLCRQMKKKQTTSLRRLHYECRSHLVGFWYLTLPIWAAWVQQPGWHRLSCFFCHRLPIWWWATWLGQGLQKYLCTYPVCLDESEISGREQYLQENET